MEPLNTSESWAMLILALTLAASLGYVVLTVGEWFLNRTFRRRERPRTHHCSYCDMQDYR